MSSDPLPLTFRPRAEMPLVFDSYRTLAKNLGALDGHSASLYLASEYLIEGANEVKDPQQFGVDLAKRNNVSTRFLDYDGLPAHLARLLIVSSYQRSEKFFRDFAREQIAMGNQWKERGDKVSPLDHCLSNLPSGLLVNKGKIWKERYAIHEYYRVLRNSFLHAGAKDDRLKKEFEKVKDLRTFVSENFQLDAPNEFDNLTFDDHLLFTRVIKYIATDVCRLGPPRNHAELLRYIEYTCTDEQISRLIALQSKGPHFIASLTTRLRDRFAFELQTFSNFHEGLSTFFTSLPNKRARRDLKISAVSSFRALAKEL